MRRLSNLNAVRQGNTIFQNLSYSYDRVGNILGLANNVVVPPPNVFGGPTNQSFAYDDLYRLTHAQGTYQFSPDKTHSYTMDMAYDTIHDITRKTQADNIIQPSGTSIPQKKVTYDFAYAYNPSGATSIQPHAPNHIGVRTYSYDANGNQTGWTHDTNGTRRNITWDDENRIQAVFDNGQEKDYKYDDQGNRVIKRGPQGETVYVNQFFTQRPGANGTKHFYAGTTRIASKLLRQDTPNSNPNGNTPFEKDIFFYHPDHLGSTNYVTDLNGKLFEHLEYFPFGESWVEENTNQQRTPYLFSAKELDEETGLYYFGARYYDPRASVWQSADPILRDYLVSHEDDAPNGGVFTSHNLALYSYGYQNPLRYNDPDGRLAWFVSGAIGAGVGAAIYAGRNLYISGGKDWGTWEGAAGAAGTGFLIGSGAVLIPGVTAVVGAGLTGYAAGDVAQRAANYSNLSPEEKRAVQADVVLTAASIVAMGVQVAKAPGGIRPATEQGVGGAGRVLADAQGATPAEIRASTGGPTGGSRAERVLFGDSCSRKQKQRTAFILAGDADKRRLIRRTCTSDIGTYPHRGAGI